MPAQLVSLGDGPSILIDKPILLIGRHPECDIQIDSRKVSRRHCCIAQVNDYLVIRDLDSTNGIRINGSRTVEGKLRPGDEVTIGSARYQVAWEDGAAAVPRARKSTLPVPLVDADDDDLEDCDEPVPLIDTARPVPGTVQERNPAPLLPSDPDLMPNSTPPRPRG